MTTVSPMSNDQMIGEWERIVSVLSPAVIRDPKRKLIDLMGLALSGQMSFWKVQGEARGYIVTQLTRSRQTKRKTFWVIYAGGISGGLAVMRDLMQGFEHLARANGCNDMKFEGRDWRKVLPGYAAHRSNDGRWKFRRVL
jgi:hypothetical protein